MKRSTLKTVILIVNIVVIILIAIFVLSKYVSAQESPGFIRGDVNNDGQVCMDDSVQIIYHLWRDGRELPCYDAADVNDDGFIDVSDVLLGLGNVFNGDLIPSPWPKCGQDPTFDYLSCENYTPVD